VSAWIPVPGWLVLASTEDGQIRPLASRGIPSTLEAAAQAVGELVARSTTPFYSADLAADSRVAKAEPRHPPAAAIGFPLECRGRIVGALIGIDRAPSAREPKLAAPPCPRFATHWNPEPLRSITGCGCSGRRRCRSPTT
jgi:hypothetical protein